MTVIETLDRAETIAISPLADITQESYQIVIEGVTPEIDGGRFPIKRVIGDWVEVEADIFRDGHDLIRAVLRYKQADATDWDEVEFTKLVNDRWTARFPVTQVGRYVYTIEAWNDRYGTWQHDMEKRVTATQVAISDVLEGVALVRDALSRVTDDTGRATLTQLLREVEAQPDPILAGALFLTDAVTTTMNAYPDRSHATTYRELPATIDPKIAAFAAWYEFFPRSASPEPGRSGTFKDSIAQIPRIAAMGFDVIYLPPIHPIGRSNRKGPNNTLTPGPNDPGSPWAIGNENGGHKTIEPSLGTMDDFVSFVRTAKDHGIEVAMDFAIQCSPDHPYVKTHPDWFFVRPDGTIKYAENPPKKYQDIYPINFYCDDRENLWQELKSIVLFWIDKGIRIFRVDNPHTKAIPFWEWAIGEIKRDYPETLFLAEAFTRPKVMRQLAKVGFSQSYTYFTWRNTKYELTEYLTELTTTQMKDYYRGSLWPNTPDILHEFLQTGGLPAFRLRLVLAATLSSVYGIYSGYELGINTPVRPGAEEYLSSDKYQINYYNWNQVYSIEPLMTRINQIRHSNPALQEYSNLTFYRCDGNENIIAYGKMTEDKQNIVLSIVNLDPFNAQEGWVGVPYWDWGIGADENYYVTDLITGATYTWRGEYNFVRLDPHQQPAHIFVVRKASSDTLDGLRA